MKLIYIMMYEEKKKGLDINIYCCNPVFKTLRTIFDLILVGILGHYIIMDAWSKSDTS